MLSGFIGYLRIKFFIFVAHDRDRCELLKQIPRCDVRGIFFSLSTR